MNATLETHGSTTMKRTSIFTLALLVTALAGCDSAAPAVCQIGSSFTGGYAVRFTRTGTPTAGCDIPTGTPAQFGDNMVFDPYAGAQGTLVIGYAVNLSPDTHGVPDPPDPQSPLYGKAYFTAINPDADDNCMMDSMTMSGPAGSYAMTELVWLSTAKYLGTEFKANAHVTRGGCTADYTLLALWPPIACEVDEDCNPFAQPIGSGINPEFNQGCHIETWTTDITGDDTVGMCFFNEEYPSLGGSFSP